MDFTYLIILAIVLVMKSFFIILLIFQIFLGFLNWENFFVGRSGLELSLAYPGSLLGLFFIITALQIALLLFSKSFNALVVVLNFINSVAIFTGMIRLSSILGFQAVSLSSIGAVFLVLVGNFVGLSFINKDKNLLKKYAGQKGLSFIHLLVVTGIVVLGGILFFPKISRDLTVENVKKLPEVQEYLKNVPNGKVEVDNELEGEYNVHVYEVKNGHTATFNWYRVNIKSGEIRPEFEITTKSEVSGKLCYPSEVLPKGVIEAKRLSDNKIFTQDYQGSLNSGKSTYTFDLEEGDYYLRYKTAADQMGYSTTVCPTGNETTCGDSKQRVLRRAVVKIGETIADYNLCDYYYKDSNAPKF